MAFCTNCGATIDTAAKFCPECGTSNASVQPAAQNQPPVAEQPQQSSYTVPVEQPQQVSYTPPVEQPQQGSYTPPVEQAPQQVSYTPPVEQPQQVSYTPPVEQPQQGNYAPQGSYAPPANVQAAGQPAKKPINKKVFIFGGIGLGVAAIVIVAAIFVVSLLKGKLLDLTASGSADPNVGEWTAVSAEMMGFELDVTDIFEDGFTIELKDKGNCELRFNDSKVSGKWTLSGTAFTVKGGGLDCAGTLKGGEIVLDNVFDMGVALVFTKDGAPRTPTGQGPDTSANPGEWNDLQTKWNGTWYGMITMSGNTGKYEDYEDMDAYMVVDVDANGKGTYVVYLGENNVPFAAARGGVNGNNFDVSEGTVLDQEMNYHDWMLLPQRDYGNVTIMPGATYTDDDGDELEFMLHFKPWGSDWQDVIDNDWLVPPGYEDYLDKVESGEAAPYTGQSSSPTKGGSKPTTPPSTNNTTGGYSGETETYTADGFEVRYPVPYFTQKDIGAIVFNGEEITIGMIGEYSPERLQERYDFIEKNEGFTVSETTIAGFPAKRYEYIDTTWSETNPDYYADYVLDFGGKYGMFSGVYFYTSSMNPDMLDCEEALALINSVTLAE